MVWRGLSGIKKWCGVDGVGSRHCVASTEWAQEREWRGLSRSRHIVAWTEWDQEMVWRGLSGIKKLCGVD
jgi:hypothetical protein